MPFAKCFAIRASTIKLIIMHKKGENMRLSLRITMPLLMVIMVLVFSVSCSKKAVTKETEFVGGPETASSENVTVYQEESTKSDEIAEIASDNTSQNTMMINLEDIFFEYDKSTLTPAAQETLTQKARWLKANTNVSVVIEGHCDERGTNEYNLALGDRRAAGTQAFLIDLGISPKRLVTISYGEERPIISGNSEKSWAKNRRAHLAVE